MIQFGTGGWRARIGEDFTCDNVRRVGGAVCAWLKENGRTDRPVIIGYDRYFARRVFRCFFCTAARPRPC